VRALVLGAVILTACRLTGTFECGLDDVCRRGDELGMCEVEGFCSFGDVDCASGRRYADSAGDGLANECVDESATPLTCRDRWRMNVVRFGAVSDLGVGSEMDDRDPWLSSDGDTLLFSSTRTGSAGADIYLATRADITVPFGTPALVPALNTTSGESRVSFSADNLTVYLNSNRTGTTGGMDVWRATRTSATAAFAMPDKATLMDFNTGNDEHDVLLSNDGLTLYLAVGRTGMPQRLATATRATTSAAFSAHAVISELDTGGNDADPSVTPDELLLVFTSVRTAPQTGSNLWYATRASRTEKWLSPRLVPDINIDGDEGDGFLSEDACTLTFSRRPSATAAYDLVYAVME
jgi:Tol biopolymer transport system component